MKQWLIDEVTASVHRLEQATRGLGDKAGWSPMDKGRTAIDQVSECALINGMLADILISRTDPVADWEAFDQARAALDTADKAIGVLHETLGKLQGAYAALPAEDEDTQITMPWGKQYKLIDLPSIALWNNTYHEGQINYIATLSE
jgi:hypothetical protein